MGDGPAVSPEDALQVAQRALGKGNDLETELNELRSEYQDTADELAAVKMRLSEIDDEREYASLTLDEKIGKVREHAYRRATDTNGKAALDYKDVMWSVFDGEPSAMHCYKLRRRAADAKGFDVSEKDKKRLTVDAKTAKRGVAFYSENKEGSEGAI